MDINDSDLQYSDDGAPIKLQKIQGSDCLPQLDESGRHPGECYLLVLISGTLPELGTDFVEFESYRLSGKNPDYEFGEFTHIDVLPPKGRLENHTGKPKSWKGWRKFDKIQS